MSALFDVDGLWEEIDEANALDDRKEGARQLDTLIERMEAMLESEAFPEATALLHYAIGYSLYMQVDRTPARHDAIVQHLEAALEADDEYDLARLYLGHASYDRADYVEARRWLQGIPPDSLATSQEWTRRELITVCNMHTDGLASTRAHLFTFFDESRDVDDLDLWPVQLVTAIVEQLALVTDADMRASIAKRTREWLVAREQQASFEADVEQLARHDPR